ncbi:ESA1-associated factor 2 [Intoshia linei]|uniref:DNA methyltransferase 1-associated protein 1 n=1 Tax=Intoshia linei TaxID=1819745 RepID=A0A177AY11_9BILA|nr:ESA1-associated factor 2 [Intoshia linei]
MTQKDVQDILSVEKKVVKKVKNKAIRHKRPKGMSRDLWNLVSNNRSTTLSLAPSLNKDEYSKNKATFNKGKTRRWKWMSFINSARKDNLQLNHWRRAKDFQIDAEYQFSRFNKKMSTLDYNDVEYEKLPIDKSWTKEETDYLFKLCKNFDNRFIIVHDRYNNDLYNTRSLDELKDRYYSVLASVKKTRNAECAVYSFNIQHEVKRRDQLEKLQNRSKKEVDEEKELLIELKRIDIRKKERERKAMDLHRLMSLQKENKEMKDKKITKNQTPNQTSNKGQFHKVVGVTSTIKKKLDMGIPVESANIIKFPEMKTNGVSLRSSLMRMPASIGQKKIKSINTVLLQMEISFPTIAVKEIVSEYNQIRQELILINELRNAVATCEYELEILKHQVMTLNTTKDVNINNKDT